MWEAIGVTGPKSPGVTSEGGGDWAAGGWRGGGGGTGCEDFVGGGGAKGRRGAHPVCLGGSTETLAMARHSEGSGSREPAHFYLFLGRSQFALSGFFRHPGTGRGKGGHISTIPSTSAESLPAATAPRCHSAKRRRYRGGARRPRRTGVASIL